MHRQTGLDCDLEVTYSAWKQTIVTDDVQYLNVRMISWDRNKLGKALAEPHGNVSFHVDSKGFKPFL